MNAEATEASEASRIAQEELVAGRWSSAAAAFRAILEHEEDPDALFGLGVASFWLDETELARRHWERAYVAYRRRPEPAGAVFAAVYLCLAYRMSLGNDAAARGWLPRAARSVDDHGLVAFRGWVLLCRAHIAIDTGQPKAAERWAREASDLARAAGDVDLELCAVSELGSALVDQGQVKEGSELLDRDAVVLISCRPISACSRRGEMRRATQWIRAADDFYRRFGSPHLYTTCRTAYGGRLVYAGRSSARPVLDMVSWS